MAWHFAPPGVPLYVIPVDAPINGRYKVVAIAWNDDDGGSDYGFSELRYLVHKNEGHQTRLDWIDGKTMTRIGLDKG